MHANYLPPKTTIIRLECANIVCQSLITNYTIGYAGVWEEENFLDFIIE